MIPVINSATVSLDYIPTSNSPTSSPRSSSPICKDMYTFELPTYTTERYYLLSELEQIVKFYYTNEESQKAPMNDNEIPEATQVAIYISWDTEAGLNDLQRKLSSSCEYVRENFDNSRDYLIAVEVFHRNSSSSDESFDGTISILHSGFNLALKMQGGFGIIIFGVTDNPGGTCALEATLDYCSGFHKIYNQKVAVISIDKQCFLGLQEDDEPDAIPNVMQYYLSSISQPIAVYVESKVSEDGRGSLFSKNAPVSVPSVDPITSFLASIGVIIATIVAFILKFISVSVNEKVKVHKNS